MRLAGNGMVLDGAEGASPPLPYIEVADEEGAVLLSLYPDTIIRVDSEPAGLFGSALYGATIAVGDGETPLGDVVRAACGERSSTDWNALAQEDRDSAIAAEIFALRVAAGRDGVTNAMAAPPAPAATADGGQATATPTLTATPDDADALRVELIEAFDLLEDDDFVKSGERSGRPKVASMQHIVGRTDFGVSEVDEAWAAKNGDA